MREHAVVPTPRPPVWHRPPGGADAAARQPILAPGPWDAPGSLTAGPAGWFTVAVEAGPDGFRLGGRSLDVAAFADAIWQCPRWRGRPVLLVTQPSAPADGAGQTLRGLADALGAPVYASDAGLHFIFGRAVAERMFWCWRPGIELEEPEPAGVVLPAPAPAHRPPPPPHSAAPQPADAPSPQRPAARQESDAASLRPLAVPLPDMAGMLPPAVEDAGDAAGLLPLVVRDEGDAARLLPLVEGDAGDVAGPLPLAVGGEGDAAGLQAFAVPVVRIAGFDLGVRQVRLEPAGTDEPDPDSLRRCGPVTDDVAPPAALPQPVESPEPAWFPVCAVPHEADRDRVRAALDWKFQTYLRVVSRAMSLHPGLRSASRAQDGGAGLVAVLALLDGVDARVNAGLRAGGIPDEQVRALARCAAAGLAQLPVVAGPVFAAVADGVDLIRSYRPGDVLVEPAFATVSVGRGGGTGPRYAIWSATARRLDQLRGPDEAAGESRAMFAAGSRFEVLAVDQGDPESAAGPGGASCVLLRELVFDRRDGDLSQRVAGRLREALAAPAGPGAASVTWPWPLGLVGGRRFALDAGARDSAPSAGGSPRPGRPEGAAS